MLSHTCPSECSLSEASEEFLRRKQPPSKWNVSTFHLLSGWLKDLAYANIPAISVTLDTSQSPISPGITSSSITVFTTFLSTLLVEDELTTIFAATFSVMLANGISDAFAVGTSLKDGIDLTRDRLLVRDIIVSELIYTFPIAERRRRRRARRLNRRAFWAWAPGEGRGAPQ